MTTARLTPLDDAFLSLESPTAHMHVGWASTLDPPEHGRAPDFERIRRHIEARLPRAPRYRQMIRPVPFGIHAPEWIDDPDFDVSRHVVRAESDSLSEVVDSCMSKPLERDRPLWQISVAERLDDGRIGLVGKAHHCMVDGVAAVELVSLLFDPQPDAPDPEPDGWKPRAEPAPSGLLGRAVADLTRGGMGLAGLAARVAGSPDRLAGIAGRARQALGALAGSVRPAETVNVLNQPISARRRLGLRSRPLDELMRIKREFGVKLNDVVLAVSAGAMRRFLANRGRSPRPLKTMVPVSMRAADAAGEFGNRISFVFVDLPCDEPDPVRRLRQVHDAMTASKRAGEPEGADAALRSFGITPAPLQRMLTGVAAAPRTFNLAVSNIPGPPETLYMAGCPLAETYPVVPLADRHALSIGMTTVRDQAFFGLYADREALPDVDELGAQLDISVDELLELSETRREPAPATVGA
jgi:diacylglycerol O-acyltransferase